MPSKNQQSSGRWYYWNSHLIQWISVTTEPVKHSNVETHDAVRKFNNGIDFIKIGQGGCPWGSDDGA